MKSQLPQYVRVCLWSYDTSKINPKDKDDRHLLIFNCLNYGNENAIKWAQENFTEKQIKAVIKKSYASAWFKWSLKRWSDFYKVFPKWRTRMEYILSKEKVKYEMPPSFDDLWPYGGHTLNKQE